MLLLLPDVSSYAAAPGRVELDVGGQVHTLQVEEGDTILQTALDNGIQLSHDCKMGVCMTCPAKLVRIATTCSPQPYSVHLHLIHTHDSQPGKAMGHAGLWQG